MQDQINGISKVKGKNYRSKGPGFAFLRQGSTREAPLPLKNSVSLVTGRLTK